MKKRRERGWRERRERKRVGARRISRSRDLRCDGVIGYELTGAKGPSRIPLRRGSRRRKLVEGRNRFIMKRGERRRRDFARRTNNSGVDTPRPPSTPLPFLRVHTRFMLLALLPHPRHPPRCLAGLFISLCAARGRREKSRHRWYLPSYLRQTVPARVSVSPSPSRSSSPCIFAASCLLTQKSRAFAISGSPRVHTRQIAIRDR